jgi:UDP-glucose 4-epimerase
VLFQLPLRGTFALPLTQEYIECMGLDNKVISHEAYGDLCNPEDLRRIADVSDGIVHLAGVSSPIGKELDLNLAHKVNVLGTLNVIEAIVASRKPKWLLFISCYNVYGIQSCVPVSESARCHPVNGLGMSKLLAEDLVRSKCDKLNIPFNILRLSNVYGSIHPSAASALTNRLIQQALAGEPLVCYGEKTTSDFIHIEDVVEAIMRSIQLLQRQHPSLPFLINICSGVETSLFELATMIRKITQTNGNIKILSSYTGQIGRFVGSREKAQTVLSWSPQIQLYEGLKKLYGALKR